MDIQAHHASPYTAGRSRGAASQMIAKAMAPPNRALQTEGSADDSIDYIQRDSQVVYALILWFSISAGLLLLYFLVLRACFPWWVTLRRDSRHRDEDALLTKRRTPFGGPNWWRQPSIRSSVSWVLRPVIESLTLTEEELVRRCGLDIFVTLRTMSLGVKCTFLLAITNSVVLMPSYLAQDRPADCDEYCSANSLVNEDDVFNAECVCGWIDRCSLASVPRSSPSLWLPAAFMLLTTLLTLAVTTWEYQYLVRVRLKYVDRRLFHTTVVELDLPAMLVHRKGKNAPEEGVNDSATVAEHRRSHENQTQRGTMISRKLEHLFGDNLVKVDTLSSASISRIKRVEKISKKRFHVLLRLEDELRDREHMESMLSGSDGNPRAGCCSVTTPFCLDKTVQPLTHGEMQKSNLKDATCGCFEVNRRDAWCACWSGLEHRLETTRMRIGEREDELRKLNQEFKQAKAEALESLDYDEYKREINVLGGREVAFATFQSVGWSTLASNTRLHHDMSVRLAPAPNDVRWNSLMSRARVGPAWATTRTILSRILFAAIVLFWGVATSAIGAVTSVNSLAQIFPGLNDFARDRPDVIIWIDRVLALIYTIILRLAFPLVQLSTRLESFRISSTELNEAIMLRYVIFLVIQVFVFYSVAGSVFKSAVDIVNQPTKVVQTLSSTIPQNAAFFLTYIAVQTFNVTLDLVRALSLLFQLLRSMYMATCQWVCHSPRSSVVRRSGYHACGCCWGFLFPSSIGVAGTNAGIILVIYVTICYSAIQPLVNLVALAYFCVARLCFGIRSLNAHIQVVDGQGSFWPTTFSCIMAALLTAHLTLFGTLLVKEGFAPAVFVIIACFCPTIALSSLINGRYRKRYEWISLSQVAETSNGLSHGEGSDSDDRNENNNITDLEDGRYGVDDRRQKHCQEAPSAPGRSINPRGFRLDLAQPLMRYNHVLGMMPDEMASSRVHSREEHQGALFRYLHPVLLERDEAKPGERLVVDEHDEEMQSLLSVSHQMGSHGDDDINMFGGFSKAGQ